MLCARGWERPRTAWIDNINTRTGLPVEESNRMTENRDKWRKYVHGVANPSDRGRLKNRTEQLVGANARPYRDRYWVLWGDQFQLFATGVNAMPLGLHAGLCHASLVHYILCCEKDKSLNFWTTKHWKRSFFTACRIHQSLLSTISLLKRLNPRLSKENRVRTWPAANISAEWATLGRCLHHQQCGAWYRFLQIEHDQKYTSQPVARCKQCQLDLHLIGR